MIKQARGYGEATVATSNISTYLIDRYAAGPSATKVKQVANLQNAIRAALGEDTFDTFLQGSYRNDTAVADINDVDIVARRKGTHSPLTADEWERLFTGIARTLRASSRVSGTISLGDKCVKLKGASLNADIVLAVAVEDFASDPIAIRSRGERRERKNYPRTHYKNGVAKHKATADAYKPTVRLFKRWARQYSAAKDFAPSFYIESAVHAVDSARFRTYLPLSFASVGVEICGWSRHKYIPTVAGDKDILVASEWHPDKFEVLQSKLNRDLDYVIRAIEATSVAEANRLWKLAFGEVS